MDASIELRLVGQRTGFFHTRYTRPFLASAQSTVSQSTQRRLTLSPLTGSLSHWPNSEDCIFALDSAVTLTSFNLLTPCRKSSNYQLMLHQCVKYSIKSVTSEVFTSPGAKYCDVSVCLSVGLFARITQQERLAVASIARDDLSTLPGDDPFPRARMHRDRNAR